ncbi:MAG: PEP/pyruvate-binding domain-containing protein [Pseudomonadota bacterium]
MSAVFEQFSTAITRGLSIMWGFIIQAMEAFALLMLLGAQPAHAIPSPELVVGSVTSLSQIAAWAWALLAGGAGVLGVRLGVARTGARGTPTGRAALWALGLLAAGLLASAAFNVWQYSAAKGAKQARLEETLLRPSRAPSGSEKDPDMKEISFREQLKHPLALSTAEAAGMLAAARRGERQDVLFLDVREAAEREMGTIPGVTFVRFPDFKASSIDFKGKKAVLFCHNGNRSSETCEALRKLGIDCQFMAGGLEKWVVEKRPMEGLADRSLRDLRAIPDYPNRATLIDTPDVKRLLKERNAQFVDIRYPTDFAEQHLPDAVNLSLRRMSTEQLNQRIAELPKRPIILPCYDRRGCFFAEVLGHELSKAGREVLGRYTLPWEYFVARPRPPHVEQWIAENEKSVWTRGSEALAAVLAASARWAGLAASIVALALLSRLLVLPFSLKAERDQLVLRRLREQLRELKARLRGDPVRRARALRAFHRAHGLTPVRNLTAMLFIPILAVALGAVERASAQAGSALLWVGNIGKPDPSHALPLLFGALLAWYLDLSFGRGPRQRVAMAAITLAAGAALGSLFNAGAVLYLAASMALLLGQRAIVQRAARARAGGTGAAPRLPAGVLGLRQPEALAGCGNKALHLAQLKAAGLPVPDGVVLTPGFLRQLTAAPAAERQLLLSRLWDALERRPLAVRSCAAAEDGSGRSHAGVFDSVLGVSHDGLEDAIGKVLASYAAPRAAAYGPAAAASCVLVQHMVDAEYAGVLFTRAPQEGAVQMVELVRGTAQDLVAGIAQPQTYRFGRCTGQRIGGEAPPIALDALLALGRQAEALFGAPQDIEWTWRAGHFALVQSRAITSELPAVQRGIAAALDGIAGARPRAEDVVLARNELSEMLPSPTPLSLSLMEAFWASGGSVDLACRRLGLAYPVEEDSPPYLVTVLGRLYVNKAEERRRALPVSSLAASRLAKKAQAIEAGFRDGFLPEFLRAMRLQQAIDFARLGDAELQACLAERLEHYLDVTHVEVDVVNVAAHVYLSQATALLARHGIEPAAVLGRIPQTCEAAVYRQAAAQPATARRRMLMEEIGHRSLVDYELAEPRFSEDPALFDDPERSFASFASSSAASSRAASGRAAQGEELVRRAGDKVWEAIERARRFQALKQDARHHSLRELALLRALVRALDARHQLGGLAFHLTRDELLRLNAGSAAQLASIAHRRCAEHAEALRREPLAATLTALDLELASAGGSARPPAAGPLRGTRVSGSGGTVTGRACVVRQADAERGTPIPGFADGDIIVAPMVSPQWVQYFNRAGGFVCEVGGWLSHTAILAREHEVTMVVGARHLETIGHHAQLRLHPDGRIELLPDAPEGRAGAQPALAAA